MAEKKTSQPAWGEKVVYECDLNIHWGAVQTERYVTLRWMEMH